MLRPKPQHLLIATTKKQKAAIAGGLLPMCRSYAFCYIIVITEERLEAADWPEQALPELPVTECCSL